MSPPVDGLCSTVNSTENESSGFYLLKKDSQRRTTLVQVISADSQNICAVWMDHLTAHPTVSQPILLRQNHLQTLLCGLRDYLPEKNEAPIECAISELKEEFEYDATALSQLQLALLLFQDAVNHVLRNHNIKPHWMFALDALVRTAVQAAITVMSPELGENLAASNDSRFSRDSGKSAMEAEGTDVCTPVTMIDTFPGLHRVPSTVDDQEDEVKKQYQRVKAENARLWSELLNDEKQLRDMLKSQINDRKALIQAFQTQRSQHEVSMNGVVDSIALPNAPQIVVGNVSVIEVTGDVGLVSWLSDRNFDCDTIHKVGLKHIMSILVLTVVLSR